MLSILALLALKSNILSVVVIISSPTCSVYSSCGLVNNPDSGAVNFA